MVEIAAAAAAAVVVVVVVMVVVVVVVVVMSNAGSSTDSEVMQPSIKHLVVCKKVMECDHKCRSWQQWSSVLTQSCTVL
jgi:hypothetical protein